MTVKLYVPAGRFPTVVLGPDPVMPPGFIVQVPVAGRPLRTTLPVPVEHTTGWVMVPTRGADGVPGGASITTLAEARETQPDDMVTVKLYIPGIRLEIVVDVPVPVIAPGLIVHVPVAGSPVSTTLPVGSVHVVGWLTVPMTGEPGVPGGEIVTISAEGNEIHPAELVTLKL